MLRIHSKSRLTVISTIPTATVECRAQEHQPSPKPKARMSILYATVPSMILYDVNLQLKP